MNDTIDGADEPQYDVDGLLRAYLAGLSAGYTSALGGHGMPWPVAHHLAGHVAEAVLNDPIARNHSVDIAIARYLDDASKLPPAGQGLIPIDIKGCGGE